MFWVHLCHHHFRWERVGAGAGGGGTKKSEIFEFFISFCEGVKVREMGRKGEVGVVWWVLTLAASFVCPQGSGGSGGAEPPPQHTTA